MPEPELREAYAQQWTGIGWIYLKKKKHQMIHCKIYSDMQARNRADCRSRCICMSVKVLFLKILQNELQLITILLLRWILARFISMSINRQIKSVKITRANANIIVEIKKMWQKKGHEMKYGLWDKTNSTLSKVIDVILRCAVMLIITPLGYYVCIC